jgi:hypothetical protein
MRVVCLQGETNALQSVQQALDLFYNYAEAQRQSRNKADPSLIIQIACGNRLSLSTLSPFIE